MNDETTAIQDHYTAWAAQCYGCGRLNPHGLHIRTFWEGDETVTRFRPQPYHLAIEGFVYGGLIASLIDCHGTGTAAAAAYRAAGRAPDSEPPLRFVTASLHVDYLRPTPIDADLEIRGRVEELKGRKVVVAATLSANGVACARGRVVAVQAPDEIFAARG
jgi:acyl-coenzyme A thioesterase PaaI-like protein